jgi:hypothetical protein
MSQVRVGWRSIYDTSGRLTQMNYYENGINVLDSNFYFQYYTDNLIKGIITGDISREEGCRTGSISLFDEKENLSSYSIKRNGQPIFNIYCNDSGKYLPTWRDQFDSQTGCWETDSFMIQNSEFILHNDKDLAIAEYKPPFPIAISGEFALRTRIPKDKNSSKIGVCLGWKDQNNYFLFEISYGESYSVLKYENGVCTQFINGRKPIDKKRDDFNEIKISSNGNSLVFEINGTIETIIPTPKFQTNTIGLMTRSRGNARFLDFIFTYSIPALDPLFTQSRIGKGTGFFISSSGKVLTTCDVIADAKSIYVRGMIDGKVFQFLCDVVFKNEEKNIAILQIKDGLFKPFTELPFGLSRKKPISESTIFSIGFPGAISGIYMKPDVFQGKVISTNMTSSTGLVLEMPFRYGMIGSPVFDNSANLIGIVTNKGKELKYTEAMDYLKNSPLFLEQMGSSETEKTSPLKDLSIEEKCRRLSEIVVIVQSSIFDIEKRGKY